MSSPSEERRGLRYALYGFLGALAVSCSSRCRPARRCATRTTGAIFGDSPFMTGILVIISIFFGVAGYAYGKGAGTIDEQRRGHQRGREDLRGPGRADLPAADHRPVHRLLQLHATSPTVLAVNLADCARGGRPRRRPAASSGSCS